MVVPIQNFYYLLSYYWDWRVSEAELEQVTAESCPDLRHFFARVLVSGLEDLTRRGLDRAYLDREELTSQPRGRIDFTASAKRQTWLQGRLHCGFDELSPDVLHNRLLKATLSLLMKGEKLCGELEARMVEQLFQFSEVGTVAVSLRDFRRVQLGRQNRSYRVLLHVCELVWASLLPEVGAAGQRSFRQLDRNEDLMPTIFEKFVLRFAQRHCRGAKVGRPHIQWQVEYGEEGARGLMPRMETDLVIEGGEKKLILDCKYTPRAFREGRFGALRFQSSHLYQLNSYLMNQREMSGWEEVEGMLLYPAVGEVFRHEMKVLGHRVRVCSLDLGQGWREIERDLKVLLNG